MSKELLNAINIEIETLLKETHELSKDEGSIFIRGEKLAILETLQRIRATLSQ